MREERLYLSIGLFVFGALLLAITAIFFFYNEYLHGKIETYVMFFKGSLNGLDATSPITYRGVKIGQVQRIELTANKARTNVAIPVYVEFFVEKSFVQKDNPIEILIDNGLVASINPPNLLTGTSSIEIVPNKAGTKAPSSRLTFHGYRQFPTQNVVDDEEDTTARDTLKTARKTLRDISKFINSKEFKETIVTIKDTADSINTLAITLDKRIPGSLVYFDSSLKQFSEAAYSIKNLSDYLARHPESLLRGKP